MGILDDVRNGAQDVADEADDKFHEMKGRVEQAEADSGEMCNCGKDGCTCKKGECNC